MGNDEITAQSVKLRDSGGNLRATLEATETGAQLVFYREGAPALCLGVGDYGVDLRMQTKEAGIECTVAPHQFACLTLKHVETCQASLAATEKGPMCVLRDGDETVSLEKSEARDSNTQLQMILYFESALSAMKDLLVSRGVFTEKEYDDRQAVSTSQLDQLVEQQRSKASANFLLDLLQQAVQFAEKGQARKADNLIDDIALYLKSTLKQRDDLDA